MFLAMNRFKINPIFTEDFEKVWRERDTFLSEVPGFKNFSLLRGPECEEHVLYVSHSVWESEEAFIRWTESDAFRKALRQSSAPKGTYLSHPALETFTAVLEE